MTFMKAECRDTPLQLLLIFHASCPVWTYPSSAKVQKGAKVKIPIRFFKQKNLHIESMLLKLWNYIISVTEVIS